MMSTTRSNTTCRRKLLGVAIYASASKTAFHTACTFYAICYT